MPNYATQYATPGGLGTVAETPQLPTISYPTDQLQIVLRERLARQLAAQRAAQQQATAVRYASPVGQAAAVEGKDSGFDLQDENFRHLQQRDQILQMQARQNPQPMRMVTGAGIIPGYVPDTNAFNSYQRQAYLPNNAGQVTAPSAPGSIQAPREPDLYSPRARERDTAYRFYRGGKEVA